MRGIPLVVIASSVASLLVAAGSGRTPSGQTDAVSVFVTGKANTTTKATEQELLESAADLTKAITGKFTKTMRVIDRREDAAIAIEVVDRSGGGAFGGRGIKCQVLHRSVTAILSRQASPNTDRFSAAAADVAAVLDGWIRWQPQLFAGNASAADFMPLALYDEVTRLSSDVIATRANAALTIGRMKDSGRTAIPALIPWLADETKVRLAGRPGAADEVTTISAVAAAALDAIGGRSAIFETLATSRYDTARGGAAMALRDMPGTATEDALVSALRKDTSARVRRRAAESLGVLGSPRGVDALIEALADADKGTRESAVASLRTITKVDFGVDVEQWKKWWAANKKG